MSGTPEDPGPGPWVIKNGIDTHFRCWGQLGPEWTENPEEALQFFRRRDAEALAAEDEDAWIILSLAPHTKESCRG